ncbi:MAG: oligoribonuclease [Opitutales bacterium]|nr:oligoribonuclease [Opitutales bacterium]
MPADERLLWLDLEMSGLEPAQDRILEAAAVVSSFRLEELERYETTVYQTGEVLAGMGQWCKQHHGASGLTARVSQGITESALDAALCDLADRYFQNNPVILAGNSIAQDRRFVDQWLPRFSQRLHYRMLDVSSFKLIYMNLFNVSFRKDNNHRALEDILESMAEMRYYIAAIDPSRMPAGLG